MIVATVGLFTKIESGKTNNLVLVRFCYDAESLDDAKRVFLTLDKCLDSLKEGYALQCLHAQAADMNEIIAACSEAAKATLAALKEAVEEPVAV